MTDADAIPLEDVGLIRLLANARGRPGGGDPPATVLLHHDRAAVIQHAPCRSTGGSCFIRCACTASRPVNTRPEISTTSPTFSARTCSSVIGAVSATSRPVRRKSSGRLLRRSASAPTRTSLSRYSQDVIAPVCASSSDAKPAKGPAVVGDRHEEAGGQAVERRDLAADERRLPPNPIGPTVSSLAVVHDRGFELRQPRGRD